MTVQGEGVETVQGKEEQKLLLLLAKNTLEGVCLWQTGDNAPHYRTADRPG